MKLSIVVPVFNVEAYISKCANSLAKQTASNNYFEVIFVNDGTKDNSISVLRKVIDFDNQPNFFLVEKENGGLSSARNYGLNNAKGEYVWFVDSDDWVDNDSVERILPLLNNNVDAVHFPSYYREERSGTSVRTVISKGETGTEIINSSYQYPAQFSIYRYDFLKTKQLEFQQGILMEDLHFTPRALYLAEKVKVADFPVYHYLQRDTGIMFSPVSKKRILDRIWISHDLYDFSQEYVLDRDKNKWRECIVIDVNAVMYDTFRSGNKELHSIAKQYINKEKSLTNCLKYSNNKKNRIWYYISRLFFNNFYLTYRFLFWLRY